MPDFDRIETTGSIWYFVGDLYLRMPRQEGPRVDESGLPRPEWGGPSSGPARDGVWHRYHNTLNVLDDDNLVRLIIEYDDAECAIATHCEQRHFIRTGPILSPPIDPKEVSLTWIEHELDYIKRKEQN